MPESFRITPTARGRRRRRPDRRGDPVVVSSGPRLARLAERFPAGVPGPERGQGDRERDASPGRARSSSRRSAQRPVAVLSGPSHAEELARGLPASVVVAGRDEPLNVRVRDALNHAAFRVYTNPDAVGVELAGALEEHPGDRGGDLRRPGLRR